MSWKVDFRSSGLHEKLGAVEGREATDGDVGGSDCEQSVPALRLELHTHFRRHPLHDLIFGGGAWFTGWKEGGDVFDAGGTGIVELLEILWWELLQESGDVV